MAHRGGKERETDPHNDAGDDAASSGRKNFSEDVAQNEADEDVQDGAHQSHRSDALEPGPRR
jgi:hypothetical protein